MIGMRVKTHSETHKIVRKAKQANIETLSHAGAVIRMEAAHSIRKRKGKSSPGAPPHTHTKRLPHAIKYAVEKAWGYVVIGPAVESAGTVGQAHEYGGRFRGRQYHARPFMRPALERIKPRLPRFWANSIR